MDENKNTLQIIESEMETWRNSRTLLQIRYRVNQKLGAVDAMKKCEEELVKVEIALSELEKMKAEL